eukprot:6179059-Prymnesium_polylepis.1
MASPPLPSVAATPMVALMVHACAERLACPIVLDVTTVRTDLLVARPRTCTRAQHTAERKAGRAHARGVRAARPAHRQDPIEASVRVARRGVAVLAVRTDRGPGGRGPSHRGGPPRRLADAVASKVVSFADALTKKQNRTKQQFCMPPSHTSH